MWGEEVAPVLSALIASTAILGKELGVLPSSYWSFSGVNKKIKKQQQCWRQCTVFEWSSVVHSFLFTIWLKGQCYCYTTKYWKKYVSLYLSYFFSRLFLFFQSWWSLLFEPIFLGPSITLKKSYNHTFTNYCLFHEIGIPKTISQCHKIVNFSIVATAEWPLSSKMPLREILKTFKYIRKNCKNMWNEAVCRRKWFWECHSWPWRGVI